MNFISIGLPKKKPRQGRVFAGLFLWFCCGLLFFVSRFALAQTPQDINSATQRSNQTIQMEQQRQQREIWQNQKLPETRIELDQPLDDIGLPLSGRCYDVREITFNGAKSIPNRKLAKLKAKFQNNCLGLKEINDLVRALTKIYVEEGYITTRAYIPQQNLTDGTLEILVVEGEVAMLLPMNRGSDINVGMAFPGVKGSVLNLNDLEQGISQLRRIGSNNVQIDLKPGLEPGDTFVFITNRPTRRINGNISIDNAGSEGTGDWQVGGTINFDDLLNLNERFYIGYRQNAENSRLPKNSNTWTGGFILPYGYFTLSGNASHYEYGSRIQGQVQDFDTNGHSTTAGLALDWVFYRHQGTTWTLGGGYTYRDTVNRLEGAELTSSTRRLSIFNISLSNSTPVWGGSFSAMLGGSFGVEGLFGADEDPPGLASDAPTNSFKKVRANVSFYKPFHIGRQKYSFTTLIDGQYANDYLPGTEQISLGSRYTVRGFDEASVAGDRGVYIRNELSWIWPEQKIPYLGKIMGNLSPYVGADAGHVFSRSGQTGGSLNGVAVGVRNFNGKVNFDFTAARPLGGAESLKPDAMSYYAQISLPF